MCTPSGEATRPILFCFVFSLRKECATLEANSFFQEQTLIIERLRRPGMTSQKLFSFVKVAKKHGGLSISTVKILNIGTCMSEQTV